MISLEDESQNNDGQTVDWRQGQTLNLVSSFTTFFDSLYSQPFSYKIYVFNIYIHLVSKIFVLNVCN